MSTRWKRSGNSQRLATQERERAWKMQRQKNKMSNKIPVKPEPPTDKLTTKLAWLKDHREVQDCETNSLEYWLSEQEFHALMDLVEKVRTYSKRLAGIERRMLGETSMERLEEVEDALEALAEIPNE